MRSYKIIFERRPKYLNYNYYETFLKLAVSAKLTVNMLFSQLVTSYDIFLYMFQCHLN